MKPTLKNNMSHKLHTISEKETQAEAYKLMVNMWIRHLPVVDATGKSVIGIVSDRDLLKADSPTTPVAQLMTSPVKSFDINTPIRKVVEAMVADKVSAFLIMENEEVAGIVTSEDMLTLLSHLLKEEKSPVLVINEILTNPIFQRTVNMASNVGI